MICFAKTEFLRRKVIFFHVGIVQKVKKVKILQVFCDQYLHADQHGVIPGEGEAMATTVFVENFMENKIEQRKIFKKSGIQSQNPV